MVLLVESGEELLPVPFQLWPLCLGFLESAGQEMTPVIDAVLA